MISLTLLLCLNSNPTDCHKEDVAFDGSIMQCALFGQAAAANYMRGRPKWYVKQYRCGSARLTDA
ncbi:hypothetical protein [Jiella marina]|uniref:hypothetical protein n=1 Tax=Jiella sp. LLJ827 TaxID=2917712 RepID=UPI0021012360|nr:hypothetical protein [Jiella sp. LLJ827]MCQ0986560.1 hypothetical protein [Jiella sp. LLJ827]